MKHWVTCSISDSTTSISLTSFTKFLWLTPESSLIDLSFLCTREWHTVTFKFQDCFRCLSSHVMNCILISKPICSFNCIIEMPSPIIFMHISKSSINTSLSSHCMWSCGEKFWNASCFKAKLSKTECRSETCSSSSDNNSVIFVINYGIVSNESWYFSCSFSTKDLRHTSCLESFERIHHDGV